LEKQLQASQQVTQELRKENSEPVPDWDPKPLERGSSLTRGEKLLWILWLIAVHLVAGFNLFLSGK
jgi:cell division protein FtsL